MPTNLLYKETDMPQTAPLPPKEALPTMYDLPSENPEEPGLPDEFHSHQSQMLCETFCPPDYPPERVFVALDLNLYYDVHHPKWYKRPDWFAVVDVPRLYKEREMRMSYVIWQEEVVPFVVVELLSESTEKEDLGQTLREINQPPTKWHVYEQILQIPYYIVFARDPDQLRAFQLTEGRYRELTHADNRLWLPEINLGLGLSPGVYHRVERKWLRWYDADGKWIPTPVEKEREQTEQEKTRADQEKTRADQEKMKVEQLAAQLRALGIEPNI